MDSLKSSLENLTGMLSVGSLWLLGAFLFLDGRTDIFHVLETYGKSTSWALVAAVPTLVIAYVLGVFAVTAATLILSQIRWLYRPEDRAGPITVATFGNEVARLTAAFGVTGTIPASRCSEYTSLVG